MPTRSIYDQAPRLTGSLALSISYGIQADTPDNEFFRMYQTMLEATNEALVPGAFLVDILPFRGFGHFIVVHRRALIHSDLLQSNTYLLGSQEYDSTRMRKR